MKRLLPFIFLLLTASAFAYAPEPKLVFCTDTLTAADTVNNQPREDATGAAFYFTDGNGNVSSLIDSSGNFQARYRYDSFGNLISKTGTLADANLIRFSGKEYHPRSGLYYYGFRYYQPNLQRWLNQDPIGIAGGLNLYGFVGNSPVNSIDPYGLEISWHTCQPNEPNLYVTGPTPYMQADSALGQVGAGVYNTLPLVTNSVNYVGNALNMVVGTAQDIAGDLVTAAGGSSGDVIMAQTIVGVVATTGFAEGKLLQGEAQVAKTEAQILGQDAKAAATLEKELADAAEKLKTSQSCPVARKAPAPNDGFTKSPHGGEAHNAAIDVKIAEARKAGATDIRKHQVQVDFNGDRVGNHLPDAQWNLDGKHYNYEIDSTETGSLRHQQVVPQNDPNAINIFEKLP